MEGTQQLMGMAQAARLAALWRPGLQQATPEQAAELFHLLRRTGISEQAAQTLVKIRLNSHMPEGWQNAGKEMLASQEKGGVARIEWQPLPMADLPEEADAHWYWTGYLARGQITLLSSHPKAGKTTLVSHFLREATQGGYLAGEVAPCRVLVVSEEHPMLWRWRQRELGFGGDLLARPFRGLPASEEWGALIDTLAYWVQEGLYDVIVLDPLASQAPLRQENDAGEMLAAITPLRRITDAGAALLLVHHIRKTAGHYGTAGRGSSALQGFVDIILELNPYTEVRDDTRRRLSAYSRLANTPPEIVLQLTEENRYEVLGLTADFTQCKREQVIKDVLGLAPEPLTRDDLLAGWPTGPVMKPATRTLLNDLQRLIKGEEVVMFGKGLKADPFRYALRARGDSPGLE